VNQESTTVSSAFDSEPRTLDKWLELFCNDDKGRARLVARIRHERDGHNSTHVSGKTLEAITNASSDRINHFLYKNGKLKQSELHAIVAHLYDHDVLSSPDTYYVGASFDVLEGLFTSLVRFLDIAPTSTIELRLRAPGRYWVYRPAVYSPGKFLKGQIEIPQPAEGKVITLTETHRSIGESKKGEHEIVERYDGIMLQKSRYPFFITTLRLKRPETQNGERDSKQGFNRGAFRFTIIHTAVVNEDGKIVSMTGMTSGAYGLGELMTAPVCLERIPENVANPYEQLDLVAEDSLPDSVRHRLRVRIEDGLVRY
jgi:hypothetical protein